MITQFIIDNKGNTTAVIIPINEYENLLHQHHSNLELTEEYKIMMDIMLAEEKSETAEYIPFEKIKDRFQK